MKSGRHIKGDDVRASYFDPVHSRHSRYSDFPFKADDHENLYINARTLLSIDALCNVRRLLKHLQKTFSPTFFLCLTHLFTANATEDEGLTIGLFFI